MTTKACSWMTVVAFVCASGGPLRAEPVAPAAQDRHHHHPHHHHHRVPAPPAVPAEAADEIELPSPAAMVAPLIATPPPATPAPAADGAPVFHPAKLGEFDFDLGQEKKATPAEEAAAKQRIARLDRQVPIRRRVLRAHVVMGLLTLGVMAATLVLGQLDYLDKFGASGDFNGKYNTPHLYLASGTAALFTTTGILALAAPVPYPKKIKADAALAHKLLMGLATAGMVTQLILGPISASRAGHLDQRVIATTHLGVGYGTFGLMAGGVLAYVF